VPPRSSYDSSIFRGKMARDELLKLALIIYKTDLQAERPLWHSYDCQKGRGNKCNLGFGTTYKVIAVEHRRAYLQVPDCELSGPATRNLHQTRVVIAVLLQESRTQLTEGAEVPDDSAMNSNRPDESSFLLGSILSARAKRCIQMS